MRQVYCCNNASSSSELAVAEEVTSDEITDRLSRLEITHDGDESATGTSTETEDVEGDVGHRRSQTNDGISNSTTNSNCTEALNIIDVNHVKEPIVTNDDEGSDDDDEDTENGKMSAVSERMSLLTLEVSAATDHVIGDQYQHMDDLSVETASEYFSGVTVDETSRHGDEKLQSDCVSVRPPDTPSNTHYVPVDQQQLSTSTGTTALISDCWNGVISDDCSHQDNNGDGDGANGTAAAAATGDNDHDECLDLSSLLASSMYRVFTVLLLVSSLIQCIFR